MVRDSNPRPSPCKGDALPTELTIHAAYSALFYLEVNFQNFFLKNAEGGGRIAKSILNIQFLI